MTIEEQIQSELEKTNAMFDNRENEKLSAYGHGVLSGIHQTLLWLLAPDDHLEPIKTIPKRRPT